MKKYFTLLAIVVIFASCSTKRYAIHGIKKEPVYASVDRPLLDSNTKENILTEELNKDITLSEKQSIASISKVKSKKTLSLIDPKVTALYKELKQTKFTVKNIKSTFKESNVFSKPNTAEELGVVRALITTVTLLLLATIGFAVGFLMSEAGDVTTGTTIMGVSILVAAIAIIYLIIKII